MPPRMGAWPAGGLLHVTLVFQRDRSTESFGKRGGDSETEARRRPRAGDGSAIELNHQFLAKGLRILRLPSALNSRVEGACSAARRRETAPRFHLPAFHHQTTARSPVHSMTRTHDLP